MEIAPIQSKYYRIVVNCNRYHGRHSNYAKIYPNGKALLFKSNGIIPKSIKNMEITGFEELESTGLKISRRLYDIDRPIMIVDRSYIVDQKTIRPLPEGLMK